jgi:hypothetical protein
VIKLYWGKITIQIFEEFLNAINFLIENNQEIVNVKKIRRFNQIKNSDRSKINFYFRFLKILEDYGFITQIKQNQKSKYYKLPNSKIEINQIIEAIPNS